jgi:hypothetical protein
MAHIISFATSRFDIAGEPPNPINPIAGHSVLAWLKPQLVQAGYRVTDPDAEDWGWYIEASNVTGSYLVGASGDTDTTASPVEWTIQVHRHRSVSDRIFGRGKLTDDDPLAALIATLLEGDEGITRVVIERHA